MRQRSIVVADKVTMEVVGEYSTARDCASDTGMNDAVIIEIAKKRRVSRGPFIYRFAEDFDPNESFDGKYNRPVRVTDCETGESMGFHEISEADAHYQHRGALYEGQTLRVGHVVNRRLKTEYLR